MYEADPWDSLHQAVVTELFDGHPYGRAVLGTRRELRATGAAELAAFHAERYRPDGAILVVGGELGETGRAAAAVEEALGGLAAGAAPRPESPPARFPDRLRRLERRRGEVGRMILALPAPPAGHSDHAPLAMLLEILAAGRASRLYRALVDEGQLCVWVAADLRDSLDPGAVTFSFELVPGVPPERAEERLLAELSALAGPGALEPPSDDEILRARRIVVADWVFEHERIHAQALAAAHALAAFDLGHPQRELARVLAAGRERLLEVAAVYLRPERGAVLGWSLPRGES
jgi:zinc protease